MTTELALTEEIARYFDDHREKLLEEFFKLLRFPSISSEPQFKEKMQECCQFVTRTLEEIGMKVEVWSSDAGHPCIFAENLEAGPSQPTILLYNHYDVQPVDPLELWTTPPFEPTIRDGEIYARGAQDNKGQLFYTLQAVKYLLKKKGRLPINVKMIIEGEEESGSVAIADLIPKKKERLKADYLAIIDMGMEEISEPEMTLGIRGIHCFDIELTGSSTDLHSGSHGGIVYNPNHALAEVLSKLRTPDGKVAVPHFYDDIEPVTAEEKRQLNLKFDPAKYREMFAAEATGGEKGVNEKERSWMRPTLEVNGMSGGYTGSGFKTVIPAKASAKISARLVPGQDPNKIEKLIVSYIKGLIPPGIKLTIHPHGGGSAVRSSPSSTIVKAFANAYSGVFKKPCGFIMCGGSIPVTAALAKEAHAEVVFVGMALPGDNVHAPNEHFGIERLKLGMQVIARALELLKK